MVRLRRVDQSFERHVLRDPVVWNQSRSVNATRRGRPRPDAGSARHARCRSNGRALARHPGATRAKDCAPDTSREKGSSLVIIPSQSGIFLCQPGRSLSMSMFEFAPRFAFSISSEDFVLGDSRLPGYRLRRAELQGTRVNRYGHTSSSRLHDDGVTSTLARYRPAKPQEARSIRCGTI